MRKFAISDEDIGFIATALYGRPSASHRDDARDRLYAVRDSEPISDDAATDLEEPPAAALQRLQRELNVASGQRDFLVGQVDSLIQRLAGAHVAAGSFNMAAAQGFTQKEVMPINAVLAQIVASNVPGPDAGP